MHPLDQSKLALFRAQLGPSTVEEALNEAIDAEAIVKACGPFDPATPRFIQMQKSFEKYAELLEKERTTQ